MIPEGLYYTKDHEWLRMDGAEAVVGITHHAQEALGDITFVELPKVGKALKAHDTMLVIESVKAASEVYAPVAGVVSAVNAELDKTPELVNQSPYDQGWLCRLSKVDAAALSGLLTAEQYKALLAKG